MDRTLLIGVGLVGLYLYSKQRATTPVAVVAPYQPQVTPSVPYSRMIQPNIVPQEPNLSPGAPGTVSYYINPSIPGIVTDLARVMGHKNFVFPQELVGTTITIPGPGSLLTQAQALAGPFADLVKTFGPALVKVALAVGAL